MNMKFIKNASIRMKLLFGFITISILLGVVGTFGALGVKSIAEDGENMYHNNLQSINMLHRIKENLLTIGNYLDELMLHKDYELTDKNITEIEKIKEENVGYIELYEITDMTSDERENWDEFNTHMEKYREKRQVLFKNAQEGNYEEAMNAMPEVNFLKHLENIV